eukprot:CAMPEP_0184866384 /NCGR_PEP_ID=MMETSP0580-20130426/22143_1 /TAXON_ID=1118495 /ORGANISM="Dactyliosolen fragilissimus" /LENGTH=265 /DNA_ID=CAMNT_0027366057 /DNA_START=729 /DNA_END=1523 /DNA_ORIENTATION=+
MVENFKGDIFSKIIENTLAKGKIICFDEFQVTDVADALILQRLFTGLMEEGAVIVATSNRPPKDLYLNGIQRDRFLPFISLLEEKMNIASMWHSNTDYRLIKAENKALGLYFIGHKSKSAFNVLFERVLKQSRPITVKINAQGREIIVPQASLEYGVARFSFDDLCRKPKGASDYLAIGENFHTVFIEDVPVLKMVDVNPVRRLILLVDSMYECQVKLIVHAETNPDGIFQVDLENQYCDESFAFDRTRSRLEEMRSDDYLRKRW